MDDYSKYNEANVACGSAERPLAIQTDKALDKMQAPEFSKRVGLSTDQVSISQSPFDILIRKVVDGLQAILSKYEVPMGLMSKLMDLQQFDVLDFIIDDSGSMNNVTDSYYPNGQPKTRWVEAIQRLKNMVEVLAYVPTNCNPLVFLIRFP